MDASPADRRPWNPDPAWADPLLALLAAAVLFLSGLIVARRQAPAPAAGVGLQGRLAELPFAAAKALPAARAALLRSLDQAPAGLDEAWDRAAVGILLAEDGNLEGGRKLASGVPLAGPAAAPFRRCWARAFEGAGAVPAEDRPKVREALGGGWAAAVLEARLARLEGLDPGPALQAAQDLALRRLAFLALAGVLLGGACLAGTAFGIYLAVARPPLPPPPPETPALAPRALALVVLAWFLGLLLSGTLVSALASALPFLGPYTLPLAYALHAGWGAFLLASAQGTGLRQLWASLTPGAPLRALRWGIGCFALAGPAVLLTGLLLSPLLRHAAPPPAGAAPGPLRAALGPPPPPRGGNRGPPGPRLRGTALPGHPPPLGRPAVGLGLGAAGLVAPLRPDPPPADGPAYPGRPGPGAGAGLPPGREPLGADPGPRPVERRGLPVPARPDRLAEHRAPEEPEHLQAQQSHDDH